MTEHAREAPLLEELRHALRTKGIRSPHDFRARYGVAPGTLTPQAALALVIAPAWVTEVWIPHSGGTLVVWVPAAVRAYAAALGITQHEGERDHDFNDRIRAAVAERREAV
jgi:hypothetical protein